MEFEGEFIFVELCRFLGIAAIALSGAYAALGMVVVGLRGFETVGGLSNE